MTLKELERANKLKSRIDFLDTILHVINSGSVNLKYMVARELADVLPGLGHDLAIKKKELERELEEI